MHKLILILLIFSQQITASHQPEIYASVRIDQFKDGDITTEILFKNGGFKGKKGIYMQSLKSLTFFKENQLLNNNACSDLEREFTQLRKRIKKNTIVHVPLIKRLCGNKIKYDRSHEIIVQYDVAKTIKVINLIDKTED